MQPSEFKLLFCQICSMINILFESKKITYTDQTVYYANDIEHLGLFYSDKVIPFLDKLNTVITSSNLLSEHIIYHDVDYIKRNFDLLFNDKKVLEGIGQLDFSKIFLFEMTLGCILKVKHPQLSKFVETFVSRLVSGFSKEHMQTLRLRALKYLNTYFNLSLVLPEKFQFLDFIEKNNQTILELQSNIKCIDQELKEIKTKKVEYIKDKTLEEQCKLLEDMARLYCQGSGSSSEYLTLKKHDEDDFKAIFGKYLNYKNAHPKIKAEIKSNGFNMEVVLNDIFNACISYRLRLTSRQCGELASILTKEVNRRSHNLGIRIVVGDIRKEVAFKYQYVDINFDEEVKLSRVQLFERSFKEKSKRKEALLLEQTKLEKKRFQMLDDAISAVTVAYQISITRQKERLYLQSQLEENPYSPEPSEVDSVQLWLNELTGNRLKDYDILEKIISEQSDNELLLSLHNKLQQHAYLVELERFPISVFRRHVSTDESKMCSKHWALLEAQIAKQIFKNIYTADSLQFKEDMNFLIKENPFLMRYRYLSEKLDQDGISVDFASQTFLYDFSNIGR